MVLAILFFILWGWVAFKRKDTERTKLSLWFAFAFLMLSTLARLGLLILYPEIFGQLPWQEVLLSFLRGEIYDVSMLGLWGTGVLVLLNVPVQAAWYRKIVSLLAAGVLILYATVLLADTIYFQYGQKHIGNAIFDFFLSVPLVVKIAFYSYAVVLVILGLASIGGLYFLYRWISRRPSWRCGGVLYEVLFLVCLGFFGWFAERGFFFSSQVITPQQAYAGGVAQGHLILNGAFSITSSLMPSWYVFLAKERYTHPSLQEISEPESLSLAQQVLLSPNEQVVSSRYPLARTRTRFSYKTHPTHLVILVIESFAADFVDALAGTQYGATPHLDTLIQRGKIYDNFYACTPKSSLLGVGTLMSGLCQAAGFAYFGRGLEQVNQQGLGSLFKQAGYEAVFVRAHADKAMYIGPVSRLMGFDAYGTERIRAVYHQDGKYDADALAVLADIFKKSQKPFVGFFFSTATHEPLGALVPKDFNFPVDEKSKDAPYLRALAYTDFAIGQFIHALQEAHLYEDTAFVITGDHILRSQKISDEKERFHVPFILVAPGILPPGHAQDLAGQADVLPTLVDLFHLPGPYSAMGRSILEGSKGWTFVSSDWEDFGFITPQGLFRPQDTSDFHQPMVALNKAVVSLLKTNRWAP